jgi:hypothetical protein
MLKYGGNKIIILLTKLYRKIIQGGKIPEEMKLGYMGSIHKKGDRKSCSNYRGICVINPIMKTFGRLIKHLLEEEYFQFRRTMLFHNRKIVYRSHFHSEKNPEEMPGQI